MKRLLIALLATTLSVAALSHSVAAQPALNPFSPGTIYLGEPWTLGWDFTPNTNVTVSALGVFDNNGDGLIDPHDVGIWDAGTEVLITSTTVTNADSLSGLFRYHAIVPVVLTAGKRYSIGSTIEDGYATDPYCFFSTFGVDPRISYDSPNYIRGAGLAYPVNKIGNNPGYFGPNFIISAAVPEPGTVATGVILVGSLGLGLLRGRRRG